MLPRIGYFRYNFRMLPRLLALSCLVSVARAQMKNITLTDQDFAGIARLSPAMDTVIRIDPHTSLFTGRDIVEDMVVDATVLETRDIYDNSRSELPGFDRDGAWEFQITHIKPQTNYALTLTFSGRLQDQFLYKEFEALMATKDFRAALVQWESNAKQLSPRQALQEAIRGFRPFF